VIVIHENRGLTDWARGVADQLAEAGYIALAPDLLSGAGPQGGRTKDFASDDAAREAIYKLTPEGVTRDLDAVAAYARQLPASNGKLAVAGFCWGGGQAFRYATHNKDVDAAFVFYGAFEHTRDQLAALAAPVYGFYAGNDERIGATVPATTALMRELGKTYEPVTYEGAAHAFMRGGEDPQGSEADRKARAAAWERWKALLAKL
jgi:carboxymethylenebutenolidase